MTRHTSKFISYGLAQGTWIGCSINDIDYTFRTDVPTSINLTPTTNELYGIKMCKRPYVAHIVQFIRIARELVKYLPSIKEDIIKINSKYSNLQYAELDINVNPFSVHKEYLRNIIMLTSYHAILYVDKPKVFKEFIRTRDILINYGLLNNNDEFTNFTKVGSEYRDGESIFDRAVYHYTTIKQLTKDSHEHTNTNF